MLDINIENKKFNAINVLNNIKIEIKQAQFISFIGPSGCGKTTLLKIISSLDEDFRGEIKYISKKYKTNKINNLGYIFQDTRLIPWLSIKENILLVAINKNEKEIESILSELGLKEYINAYPKELSGGMKRKVAIIRAFINKPEVLLLDEPFVSLDYPNAQLLRKLLFKFYKQYLPIIILVSHNLEEALFLSNKIFFFKDKPTSIIYEYKNIPTFDEEITRKKKQDILKLFPNILSGKLNE